MKLLLDTHSFIWWNSAPEFLSKQALALLEDEANEPVISAVNIWEIQIKNAAGKMDLTVPLENIVKTYSENGIEILPVYASHILQLNSLADHHRDPFDRMLVAQAQIEDLLILSRDSEFSKYPVRVVW